MAFSGGLEIPKIDRGVSTWWVISSSKSTVHSGRYCSLGVTHSVPFNVHTLILYTRHRRLIMLSCERARKFWVLQHRKRLPLKHDWIFFTIPIEFHRENFLPTARSEPAYPETIEHGTDNRYRCATLGSRRVDIEMQYMPKTFVLNEYSQDKRISTNFASQTIRLNWKI